MAASNVLRQEVLRGVSTNFDRIAQAEFEEAVADGSYVAGPDFEWESEDAREGL